MGPLRVQYLPDATADIEEIFLFVLERARDAAVATDYVDRIRRRCEAISDAPLSGVERDQIGPGVRSVPFESRAVILYRVNDETIDIVGIFHGGRDYETLARIRFDPTGIDER